MDELSRFISELRENTDNGELTIENTRFVVSKINEFLYTTHNDIGYTQKLGDTFQYFSEFHKYWENNYKEILDVKISDEHCSLVAEKLHDIYVLTNGDAFSNVYDTKGLSPEAIAQVRFLTANQDFRGSRSFADFADIYLQDPAIFDADVINNDPEEFLKALKIQNLSQSDKRITYARKVSEYLITNKIKPIDIPSIYNNDVFSFRQAITSYVGAGYGNKKADMFIRDMVVLGVWNKVNGFDKIDVASDVNTIKVALKTGILQTAIPLVSSFLDIFCYQYGYIDQMNAKAWRRVWEIWYKKYPEETIQSPCLIDYFVYNVVGKQFCKESLYEFKCDEYAHTFKWHSGRNKRCQICYANGSKSISAHVINRKLPCSDEEGYVAISQTDFVKSLPDDKDLEQCPFIEICNSYNHKQLSPPKSISIKGRTGWTEAYATKESGGGGLMA